MARESVMSKSSQLVSNISMTRSKCLRRSWGMDLFDVSAGSIAMIDTRHGTLMVHWSLPAVDEGFSADTFNKITMVWCCVVSRLCICAVQWKTGVKSWQSDIVSGCFLRNKGWHPLLPCMWRNKRLYLAIMRPGRGLGWELLVLTYRNEVRVEAAGYWAEFRLAYTADVCRHDPTNSVTQLCESVFEPGVYKNKMFHNAEFMKKHIRMCYLGAMKCWK